MMPDYSEPRCLYTLDERGEDTEIPCATIVAATPAFAQAVLNAPVAEDGRSPWLWVRLQNGDLLLATFPRGDTYLETEADPVRP